MPSSALHNQEGSYRAAVNAAAGSVAVVEVVAVVAAAVVVAADVVEKRRGRRLPSANWRRVDEVLLWRVAEGGEMGSRGGQRAAM